MSMNLFAQITKVDEAKRLVIGRAVQEVPDRAGEIFDYASSRPHFEEWSKSFADDTDGKSLGNLRAMHGKVAAGKLTRLDFNDTDKAIDISAKIVDDNEWVKVQEGVYTGFSIGGSYVEGSRKTEKVDGRDIVRYTAKPAEISLVDSPCVPSAKFFEVLKADGKLERVEFKATPLEVAGSDAEVAEFARVLNDCKFTMADAIGAIKAEQDRRIRVALAEKVRAMHLTVEAIEADQVLKREFSADERKKSAKEGHALPDGSFPIENVSDLHNAIQAYGRAKDKAKAKAHIIARAKALGASKDLPEAWTKAAEPGALKKGLWSVSGFASCIEQLCQIARSAEYDLQEEEDESDVPMKLRNAVEELIEIFKEMADEEAAELLEELKEHAEVGEDDEIEEAMEAMSQGVELRKALEAAKDGDEFRTLVAKHIGAAELLPYVERWDTATGNAGMRKLITEAVLAKAMPQAHKDKIQAIHDHAAAMGAECEGGGGEKASPATELVKVHAQMESLQRELEKIKAQPMPHVLLTTVSKAQVNAKAAADAADYVTRVPYDQLVKFADGTVDWVSSEIKHRPAAGE
jgi:hypothetical protein